jgi:CRP/FNR family cyclic AMP-dependent transcriptional regulator
LVEHNNDLALKVADNGTLGAFKAGDSIITQGASDNDVYLLLSGEVDVYVNLRCVATRSTHDTVGEMAVIDPSAPRSATVSARSDVVVLKLSEPVFQTVAVEFPHVWRVLAQIVADKLRQRAAFLSSPNVRPVLFIGSSAETLNIAEAIALGLKHANIDAVPWTAGIFGAGGVTIDSLMSAVAEADYAAFVFGPDDTVVSRGDDYSAPRDNVVFELGLFMGRLDRTHAVIIKEQHSDIKIPTDLLGVTAITYIMRPGATLDRVVQPVCIELKNLIAGRGSR